MHKNWFIEEDHYSSSHYHHKETVFTIGNGYFSSRGSFEEGFSDEIATTFVHGVFNDVPTFGTELVNFPKWYSLAIILGDEPFRMDSGKILFYQRQLNLGNGLLTRKLFWESPKGSRLKITFERFMNMADVHHGALRFSIESDNYQGKIRVLSDIPGYVTNERYQHWSIIDQGYISEHGCYLTLQTLDTGIEAALAQKTRLEFSHEVMLQYWHARTVPTLAFEIEVEKGDMVTGVKHCAIYTSRESDRPLEEAVDDVNQRFSEGFDTTLGKSEDVWKNLWDRSDVSIEGDDLADQALRYNLFQILIAAPRHDDTVSIGAKTMSGYGYRGHVFWDTEIFILPFLIFTQPEIARNLLMYRYHTLGGARQKAIDNGYKGAMFAWESAATGEEVTPTWVEGPDGELVRVWCGDIEQHITADVAYAVLQYWQVTGDDDFMVNFGTEIFLSAAQFYTSRLEWEETTDTYHIRNIIGPDEYHEHVDDNAFTNLMARWVLEEASEIKCWMKTSSPDRFFDLLNRINLTEEEIASWPLIAEKLAVRVRSDGVIEQFDGYFNLKYLNLTSLEPREQSLQRLFGIEGVQEYQFLKQPDVIMAQYLLRNRFDPQQIIQNLAYYTPRTDLSQGSSLGPSIQALMLARYGDIGQAETLFKKTLLTDLDNNRGNTPDGIHAASAGAVWKVVFFGFLGFNTQNSTPQVNPKLPERWKRVRLKIRWKNKPISFDINE